jgi:site-specific recombinase XerD
MSNFMHAKSYSPRSIENYLREIRFIFSYYNDLPPKSLTQQHIIDYLNFIKAEHGVGRDKCRMVAHACGFFYKHIFRSEYVVPSAFYPRKEFRLPDILSQEQVLKVLSSSTNIKHKLLVGLFYGTGMQMSELKNLQMEHIRALLELTPLRPVIKIPVQQRILEKYGKDITLCPCCKVGKLEIVETKRFGTKPTTDHLLNRFINHKNKEPTI